MCSAGPFLFGLFAGETPTLVDDDKDNECQHNCTDHCSSDNHLCSNPAAFPITFASSTFCKTFLVLPTRGTDVAMASAAPRTSCTCLLAVASL